MTHAEQILGGGVHQEIGVVVIVRGSVIVVERKDGTEIADDEIVLEKILGRDDARFASANSSQVLVSSPAVEHACVHAGDHTTQGQRQQ